MDKTDRSQINRVVDKPGVKKLDSASKAKESAARSAGKNVGGAMTHRPGTR